ncbi:GAP family protein [Mycobacterium palustre]|nr:GAP family protein [Mycobacterium palustre]
MLMDPTRFGIAAVLMSRRRAMVSLLACWVGGMIAGVAVGIAVLIMLHDIALAPIQAAASAINNARSAVVLLAGDHLHLTLGVMALATLALMVARDRGWISWAAPVLAGGGAASESLPARRQRSIASAIGTRIHAILESGFAWPAFVVGLGSTVPPIEGPMVLTFIMGSRAPAGTQFLAFMLFVLLGLAFIELPLVSYLAAPQKTQAAMRAFNAYITAHRRQIFEVMLALMAVGSLMRGISSL